MLDMSFREGTEAEFREIQVRKILKVLILNTADLSFSLHSNY